MKEQIDEGAAALVADLATLGAEPRVISLISPSVGADGVPASLNALFDAENKRLVSLKPLFEEYRFRPERREGTATVDTLGSFIALVNRHKDADSAVFARATYPNPSLTAVLDYHEASNSDAGFIANAEPRYGRHRIVYPFPISEEFKAWVDQNAKPMTQQDFAVFLEDRAAELSAPLDGEEHELAHLREKIASPNELIELARSLEVFVGSKVKQQQRLASGERVVEFTEEHTNGKGERVEFPGLFIVSVAPFVDGVAVRFPARLRYRIGGGNIVWFYQLYRWEECLRVQVKDDLARVAEKTGLPTFEGVPEAK